LSYVSATLVLLTQWNNTDWDTGKQSTEKNIWT